MFTGASAEALGDTRILDLWEVTRISSCKLLEGMMCEANIDNCIGKRVVGVPTGPWCSTQNRNVLISIEHEVTGTSFPTSSLFDSQ